MSNKKKLREFKKPLAPSEIASVAALINGPVSRRERRGFRRSAPLGSILQDHHKPHGQRPDCGPACSKVWTS